MIDFDDWLQKWMTADAQEAADLLRLALAEADEDSRGLLVIAHTIIAAHGSRDVLGGGVSKLILGLVTYEFDPN